MPPEIDNNDLFGYSVAIDNHVLVIGSQNDDTFGSALVYHWIDQNQTWVQEAKLSISNQQPGDKFGSSVGCSGNHVVVGAPYHDVTGAVYIYHRDETTSTWELDKELAASDSTGLHHLHFGASVAISGDFVIVGSPNSTNSLSDEVGSAYIYFRDNEGVWGGEQKLVAKDAVQGAQFGVSVGIHGIFAVVGSRSDIGAVYVYRFSLNIDSGLPVWSEEAKLVPIDSIPEEQFGFSVAVYGNVIVAGAPLSGSSVGVDSGAAFIYRWSPSKGWLQESKLTPDNGESLDNFGSSVSISDNIIIVGSEGGNTHTGAAFVFVYQEEIGIWTNELELTAGSGAESDKFGASVSVSGLTVIVGSPFYDGMSLIDSGSAVVFKMIDVSAP